MSKFDIRDESPETKKKFLAVLGALCKSIDAVGVEETAELIKHNSAVLREVKKHEDAIKALKNGLRKPQEDRRAVVVAQAPKVAKKRITPLWASLEPIQRATFVDDDLPDFLKVPIGEPPHMSKIIEGRSLDDLGPWWDFE